MNGKNKIFSKQFLLGSTSILVYFALIKFFIHFFTNLAGGYGYFRDELYYIACSDHLAFGYVDQPPLSILLLWISRFLFGDSLIAIRFFPAIAGALLVFFTGIITRELGGNRFAQIFAMLAVIAAPIYLALDNYFSMNSIDLLLWVIALYLIIKIIKTGNNRYWLALGIVLGIGLLNKISVLWLGFGLSIGLLCTPHRKYFLTSWPWLAAAIALAIFIPHIIWQIVNQWPTLEFMHNAATMKMVLKSPLDFFVGQIFMINPAILPFWLIGIFAFFFIEKLKEFRLLAWIYLAVCLLLMFSGTSRDYYLAPLYPMLFASGAITIEQFIRNRSWRWLKPLCIAHLVIAGIISLPMGLPVLPVERYIEYADFMGMSPEQEERKEMGALPQYYADMHGWQEMVEAIAGVYYTLSPEEREKCAIFTWNYGEAGAIAFFGDSFNLPAPIATHNNYWLWGPGETGCNIVIILGGNINLYLDIFERVERAAVFSCDYCMPYENNLPIYIARDLKIPINQLWPNLKHYD
jgi:hypothetical protein